METRPYSIYTEHRPIKIAFLVDSSTDLVWIDRIMAFNREKWGGRFNPIILTDGKCIEDSWWKFLRDYDPDIIKSVVELEDELLKKIHTFLTPFSVEIIDTKEYGYIHFQDDPISILPTKQNISIISRSFMGDESTLALFDVNKEAPEQIKKFIERNFGNLEDKQSTPYYLRQALQGCKKKIYKISDYESLNQALLDLGDFHNRITFSTEVCSIPNYFKETEYSYEDERFTVIMGDTADEVAYFWNRAMQIRNWMRQGFTQLWISNEIASNSVIKSGLTKFLIKFSERTGNNDHHAVNFVSFSLPEEKIKEFSDSIDPSLWRPKYVTKFTSTQVPNFNNRAAFFILKQGLEFFRAHSEEEHIVIEEPNVDQGVMGGQQWITNLYIQFRPERFENIIGHNYWWQLPRRNGILRILGMFNKEARINEYGMFSLMMRRQTDFSPEEKTLIVKLPEDRSIFYALFCGESYSFFKGTDREKFLSIPYHSIERSDKGMYLSGILSLFPDLLNAHYLLAEEYWRKIFEKMSNKNASKDPAKKIEISNVLKKIFDKGYDFKNPENLSWLSEKMLALAKNNSLQEVDLFFDDFFAEAKLDSDKKIPLVEDGKEIDPKEIIKKEKALGVELKNDLSDLIEQNILLSGIKPRCPRCGYKMWYHINEVKQQISCRGCDYTFSLNSEEAWSYKLNSLVRAAFSLHGTVPVLLALGQLMNDARSSFIFIPSTNLIKEGNGKKRNNLNREIDLACIKDGKLIIGEVKQTMGLFHKEDFEKMAEIAELIKPDIILFTSLDENPNKLVKENIDILRDKLKHLEIKVEWYKLRS